MTAAAEIDEGMSRPVDEFGPPWVGVLAPTYDKAELSIILYTTWLTEAFGRDKELFSLNQNKHELIIKNPLVGTVGARLKWLSSDDPYSVVGYTFSKLIIDEAQAVPDAVYTKIRPALDVREADIRAFGTPDITPEQSWFRGMWLRGQDSSEENVHSFTLSCYNNRWMSPETIAEAKATIPENEFRRLYLGEWVDEGGSFFSAVEDAIIEAPAFKPDHRYVMGIDFAIHEDYNVVMIAEAGTRKVIAMERWNKTDPITTYDRIHDLWVKYNRPLITADETGLGEPMVWELRDRGMKVRGIKLTSKNKLAMLQKLSSDIEHSRIMYPRISTLINELKGIVYKQTPSGKVTAEAAAGYHDDCVIALMLVNEGLRNSHPNVSTPQRNYLGEDSWRRHLIRS